MPTAIAAGDPDRNGAHVYTGVRFGRNRARAQINRPRKLMTNLNLDGKTFRSAANTPNGEVGAETLFRYHQSGSIVSAEYSGGAIVTGHLLAVIDGDGRLDMRYHHLNDQGELMVGRCVSIPEAMPDGRLRYHETWQWLTGDQSSGQSTIEEVAVQNAG